VSAGGDERDAGLAYYRKCVAEAKAAGEEIAALASGRPARPESPRLVSAGLRALVSRLDDFEMALRSLEDR